MDVLITDKQVIKYLVEKYKLEINDHISLSKILFAVSKQERKMKKKVSQHDVIWEHILLNRGFDSTKDIQYITADDIKNSKDTWAGKKSQFEPRILCKQDSDKRRPAIFKKLGIYILSVKNGTYALVKENIYVILKKGNCPTTKIVQKHNSSILSLGNSETTMLDKLRYNGIIEEIIDEKILYGPILGGRHRCHFSTLLGKNEINISGSQFETDAVYETEKSICIIEAKSINSDSFNIRQLYYPFRYIYDHVGAKKKIFCLFIYKDKSNVIHIHKFIWNNPEIMLDIKCIGYWRYI